LGGGEGTARKGADGKDECLMYKGEPSRARTNSWKVLSNPGFGAGITRYCRSFEEISQEQMPPRQQEQCFTIPFEVWHIWQEQVFTSACVSGMALA